MTGVIDAGVIRAQTTLRLGDKIKVAGRGHRGNPLIYRFSHWNGRFIVSATGVDDISVVDVLAVNGVPVDFYSPQQLDDLQRRNGQWLDKVNDACGTQPDLQMRLRRFMEEATELCQAGGLSREDALVVFEDAYSRPVGEVHQEFGGTMVTLLCLANVTGHSVDVEARRELLRIDTPEMVQKIADKQAVKAARGM